jgi:N-methylhydantoinase B
MGDLRAQLAAAKTGERRFMALLQRYGRDTVLGSIAAIHEQSAVMARQAVQAIPDGVYEAESYMDDDAVHVGQPIPIRVKVIVAGDEMTVDLSGVSRQVPSFMNSGETAGRSAAQVAFKCLTTPTRVPINHGDIAPLKIILPPGRVVSAVKPAAVRRWNQIPMTLVDTIILAMAPVMPRQVAAGHHADLLNPSLHGVDPRTGRFYVMGGVIPGGGWGAKHNSDGMNAVVCINDGDFHNTPIEVTETRYPVHVEEYSLRQDSGGAGRFRGGLGIHKVSRALGEATLHSNIERTRCAPWGLFGGRDALPNRLLVQRANGQQEQFATGKALVRLEPGDTYTVESGGGGGYEAPWARPAERVQQDVAEGYVSAAAACQQYGVVLDATTQALDAAATAARRQQMREGQ